MILIKASETSATRRRVYFQLVDGLDGITPETGEAGGQPQISIDGSGWSDTGIGVLVAVGHGRYYAELASTAVASAGSIVETRYKSADTAECPGDSVQVVAFDPHDSASLGLARLDAAISSRSTYAGGDTAGTTTLLARLPDTLSLASINAQVDGALADYDAPTHSELTAAFTQIKGTEWSASTDSLTAIAMAVEASGESELTAGEIASAVWDEELADHTAAGSAGAGLAAAGAAGDPWATLLPGSYTAGQAGQILGDHLDAAISSRSSHTPAEVWTASSRTLTAFDFLALGDIAPSVITQSLTGPHDAGTVGQVLSDLNHKIIRMGHAK